MVTSTQTQIERILAQLDRERGHALFGPGDPLTGYKDDALALSWAAYHVWLRHHEQHGDFNGRRWIDLRDLQASAHDHEMARVTRLYYRDSLTLAMLRGQQLTAFRKALYEVVSGEVVMRQDHLGILYRLPYFYVEDQARLHLAQKNSSNLCVTDSVLAEHMNNLRTVHPVTKILRSRKIAEVMEFWWKDQLGDLVLWQVRTNNPLLFMVQALHQRAEVSLRGEWLIKHNRRYGLTYWAIDPREVV